MEGDCCQSGSVQTRRTGVPSPEVKKCKGYTKNQKVSTVRVEPPYDHSWVTRSASYTQ